MYFRYNYSSREKLHKSLNVITRVPGNWVTISFEVEKPTLGK